MLPQRLINRASKTKRQVIEISNDKVKILVIAVNKQVSCLKRSTSSIGIIIKEARLTIACKPAKTIGEHKDPIKQVAFKIVIKMQLSKVVIQGVLLKDEELGNQPTRQAEIEIRIAKRDEIREGPAHEQLQESGAKAVL